MMNINGEWEENDCQPWGWMVQGLSNVGAGTATGRCCAIRKWLWCRSLIGVNSGRGRHPVVVAWRRRWDAKSEEDDVADWLMSTKEDIQLLLHGDGR